MFKDIKKYVINLKRNPERLKLMLEEIQYMGIDVEIREGIDTHSHVGCALSHLEVIKMAKEQGLDKVMVMEDDLFFMPYAKSLLKDLEEGLRGMDYSVLNLSPSIHRPVSKRYNLLLDISDLPPKEEKHRDIFSTGCIIYSKEIYDELLNYDDMIAVDELLANSIYPSYQSYIPILPICCQHNNYSEVSGDFYNNFFIQTYNWNGYCPTKLPTNYFDFNYVKKIREKGDVNYKTILN